MLSRVGPGQELVDLAVGVAVDDPRDDIGEIGVRLDAAEFTGLDERGDDSPVLAAAVRRDVMMPGVWAARLSSPIHFIRFPGSLPLSSPIRCMAAPAI